MPSEEAQTLADSVRGFVVAPAGCGKTFLLAEAVSISVGRQLILTHTHAGVRAIRGHLERQAVSPAKYGVITIDGLCSGTHHHFPRSQVGRRQSLLVATGGNYEAMPLMFSNEGQFREFLQPPSTESLLMNTKIAHSVNTSLFNA